MPKERAQKRTSNGLSKIDSSKNNKSVNVTTPITKYKYSDIL